MVRQALTTDMLPAGIRELNEKYMTEIYSILKNMITDAGISDAGGTVNLFFSMLMGFTIVQQNPAYSGELPDPDTWKRVFRGTDNG